MEATMTNLTTAASAACLDEPERQYDLALASLDIERLLELLDVISLYISDMDFGHGASRNTKLERISALTKISVDFAELIFTRMSGERS
jgi:hypothetical protein